MTMKFLKSVPWLGWLLAGGAMAVLSWGELRTPLAAVLFPVGLYVTRRRWNAFVYALAYHAGVAREVPWYSKVWLDDSLFLGALVWLTLSIAGAAIWSLVWTSSSRPWKVGLCAAGAFLLAMCSPILPGHPIVGWGFLASGTGWLGFVLAVAFTSAAAITVRRETERGARPDYVVPAFLLAGVLVLAVGGFTQKRLDGRVVGDSIAFTTNLGPPPSTSEQIIQRMERVGAMAKAVATGEGRARLVVFPETMIGRYDTSYGAVFRNEIVGQAKEGRQFIVVGAEILQPDGTGQNIAILTRPDGTTSYAQQRLASPISMWAPWRKGQPDADTHFPIDLRANNILTIEGGVKARVMFCYEEYLPALHLLNELLDDHSLVIAMANSWSGQNLAAAAVQEAHTEGMVRLFGRRLLRAENFQPEVGKARMKRNETFYN